MHVVESECRSRYAIPKYQKNSSHGKDANQIELEARIHWYQNTIDVEFPVSTEGFLSSFKLLRKANLRDTKCRLRSERL